MDFEKNIKISFHRLLESIRLVRKYSQTERFTKLLIFSVSTIVSELLALTVKETKKKFTKLIANKYNIRFADVVEVLDVIPTI